MHQQPAGEKDSHLLSELICCRVNYEIKWNKIIFPIAASKGAEWNQRGKRSYGESGDVAAVFGSAREILWQKRSLRQAVGSALCTQGSGDSLCSKPLCHFQVKVDVAGGL